MSVRHLAGPDAICEQIGLAPAKFAPIVRLATFLAGELEDDTAKTCEEIARETGATADQVQTVWQAWVRTDQHPAARR